MQTGASTAIRTLCQHRATLVLLTAIAWLASIGGSASASTRSYVALGDSLAAGVGASDPASTGYVPRLFAELQRPGRLRVSSLVNLARSGDSSAGILNSQLPAARSLLAAPHSAVRLVTIDIGANDLLSNPICLADPAGPACGFAGHYQALLSGLQTAAGDHHRRVLIAAMAYANPWSGTGLPQEPVVDRALVGSDGRIDCAGTGTAIGLDDVIACLDAAAGVRTVDLFDPMRGQGAQLSHILQGDVHFNDAGHQLAADLFAQVLRAAGDDDGDDAEIR
jgi:lysophospholipase L1-like esterase